MTSYLFIESLFKAVLCESKKIRGRFYVCALGGQEINTDNLEEVIKDQVRPVEAKKYPLSLMQAPTSEMTLKDDRGEWERYQFVLFFLTTSFYLNNHVKRPNPSTGTSMQPIHHDWEEMKSCAKDFVLQLGKVGADKSPAEYPFRLVDQEKKYFDPVTLQGEDRASGVRLMFKADVWIGCEIEDYAAEPNIVIPKF